jgi:hypothetical protein
VKRRTGEDADEWARMQMRAYAIAGALGALYLLAKAVLWPIVAVKRTARG